MEIRWSDAVPPPTEHRTEDDGAREPARYNAVYPEKPSLKGAAMFDIGLIRVLTSSDETLLNAHGALLEKAYPGLRVESRCIPDQPEGIHSPAMEAHAVPKIVELARTAFAHKDMIMVSCAEDPGVPQVRAALPGVPVIGAGEAAAALALKHSERIGIVGITDEAPKAYIRMFGAPLYDAQGERNADASDAGPCTLVANLRPHGVHSTLDLMDDEGRAACLASARALRDKGAGVIALGCTGMATIGIASAMEQASGLPVVDPVLAMGAFACFETAKRRL